MVNQKIVDIVADTAANHMRELVSSMNESKYWLMQDTVYYKAFLALTKEFKLTPAVVLQRIELYVDQRKTNPKSGRDIANNLFKEAYRPQLRQDVFKRLLLAVFPD